MRALADKLRAGPWLLAALVMVALVAWLNPHQLGVLLWSLTKLSLGAYLGYWIDRSIFPYARPGDFTLKPSDTDAWWIVVMCMLRRAVIISAAILALGLGL